MNLEGYLFLAIPTLIFSMLILYLLYVNGEDISIVMVGLALFGALTPIINLFGFIVSSMFLVTTLDSFKVFDKFFDRLSKPVVKGRTRKASPKKYEDGDADT